MSRLLDMTSYQNISQPYMHHPAHQSETQQIVNQINISKTTTAVSSKTNPPTHNTVMCLEGGLHEGRRSAHMFFFIMCV